MHDARGMMARVGYDTGTKEPVVGIAALRIKAFGITDADRHSKVAAAVARVDRVEVRIGIT